MKQLKNLSNALILRTECVHDSISSVQMKFSPPKSGSNKAAWISAIGAFFHAHASNKMFLKLLSASGPGTPPSGDEHRIRTSLALSSATSETISPLTRASAKISAPTNIAKKTPPARKHRVTQPPPEKSPIKANVSSALKSARDKHIELSPSDIKASRVVGKINVRSNSTRKTPSDAGTAADKAVAGKNSDHQNASGVIAAGLIRPANLNDNDNTTPRYQPAKIKLELLSHTSTSQSTQFYANVGAGVSSIATENLVPHDFRESNMVAILRNMGFTCMREILTALRAVAANREEVCWLYATNGVDPGWSVDEHVDAAMMWIVTQREEAAEASKLDEARVSSEQANLAMEQSRNQEMASLLENADSVDLIGLVQDDIEIKSKFFPCSTLLRNRSVKKCFLKIINSKSKNNINNSGKKEVIRLLNLEKKARKWYGTVLPFSYFEHILRHRIESWAGANAPQMCQKLVHECVILEKALYNLSEQEEGGVGSVPKLFLTAQRDASRMGKSIDPEESRIKLYDDVELLQQPLPSISDRSCCISSHPVEVIDVT